MSLPSAVIDAMIASGCTAEQLGAAVKAAAAEAEVALTAKRAKAAEKKRLQRHPVLGTNRDKSGQIGTDGDNPSPKKETSPTPPKEKTTPSQSEPSGSSKTPRQALECVLDNRRAGAVIDHRQRIGKPLTAHAAGLLAGKFAECPDPNAAADEMVANGWQGFKPEWLDRQKARGSPSQPQPRYDPFKALAEELADGQDRSERSDRSDWDDAQGLPVRTIEHHR